MGATGHAEPRAGGTGDGSKTSRNGGSSSALQAEVRALHAAPAGAQEDGEEPFAPRIAIVDRDTGFLLVLAKRLEPLGWRHRTLPAAKASLKAIAALQADVLVVDLALLGARRWRWLAGVCEQRTDLRVIVCTGASTVAERVCALRMGVDDWLGKPCHPEELIARIEAVTCRRRHVETRDLDPLRIGELEIRPDQFQGFVDGSSLRLTRREYQLVELLARAEGEVLAREQIYECLWGTAMLGNERSVDVFVHKLRRKLEQASPGWRYVHTHFGVGYRMCAELVESALVHELPRVQPAAAALAA